MVVFWKTLNETITISTLGEKSVFEFLVNHPSTTRKKKRIISLITNTFNTFWFLRDNSKKLSMQFGFGFSKY